MRFCNIVEKTPPSPLPQIHTQLFMSRGIKATYEYYELPYQKESQVLKLMEKEKYDGFNIGNPYRQSIVNYLDQIDERTKISRSVNTVTRKGINYYGYNTEYASFMKALQYSKIKFEKHVTVIGTTATAVSLGLIAAENGCNVTFMSDKYSAAQKAVSIINAQFPAISTSTSRIGADMNRDTLILNTTADVHYDDISFMLQREGNAARITGYYDTAVQSNNVRMYREMEDLNIPCTDGLRLTLELAAASHNIWLGLKYKPEEIDEAYSLIRFALSIY